MQTSVTLTILFYGLSGFVPHTDGESTYVLLRSSVELDDYTIKHLMHEPVVEPSCELQGKKVLCKPAMPIEDWDLILLDKDKKPLQVCKTPNCQHVGPGFAQEHTKAFEDWVPLAGEASGDSQFSLVNTRLVQRPTTEAEQEYLRRRVSGRMRLAGGSITASKDCPDEIEWNFKVKTKSPFGNGPVKHRRCLSGYVQYVVDIEPTDKLYLQMVDPRTGQERKLVPLTPDENGEYLLVISNQPAYDDWKKAFCNKKYFAHFQMLYNLSAETPPGRLPIPFHPQGDQRCGEYGSSGSTKSIGYGPIFCPAVRFDQASF